MKLNSISTKIRVPYALAVYGKEEVDAVNRVLKEPTRIVSGFHVKQFQQKIADVFGKRYGIMVNSGSSANLLAFEILDLPKGSEVITPVLTFSTTVAPILQKGLVPVFADVQPGTYLIDIDQIEKLITEKTRALIIPSLIGNIPDLARLKKIAKRHNLFFIEDSCDTLGAQFAGKPTGYYSDISTASFYASHIITAGGGGGMMCVNDHQLAKRALVTANWGRQSTLFGSYEESEEIKKRFAGKLAGDTYDAKFIFSTIGYNFQPLEMSAAFGIEQLKHLSVFAKRRQQNFAELLNFFKTYETFFVLPHQNPKAITNWLAFPLTLREGAGFTRHEITKFLEEQNIQTRPIFTGNILKQPGFKNIKHRGMKSYPNADYIMKNAFLVGCHHGLKKKHLAHLKETFETFLNDIHSSRTHR